MKKNLLVLSALALVLAGCSRQPAVQEPVRAVKVVKVGAESFGSTMAFSGEVRARVESRLGFRVSGKIAKRHVELGQRVQAGQVLAQLDAADYRLAVEAARAQVEAARTQRDLATADFKRFQSLKEQNFISGAELERREATLKAAQAQLEQAQAQLAVQGNQAGYATLRADVAGVVTALEAEVGQVVSAGTPIVRIAADGPRDVVFAVSEDKAGLVKTGLDVKIKPWARPEQLSARVHEVSASADPLTRTFQVKAALERPTALALGATVSVSLSGLGAHAPGQAVIKLPTTALRQEGQGTAVWVLDEASMTVKLQPVQVSTADGNEAVITSGLDKGMLVVSAGVHVLSPGQKVSLFNAAPAQNAAK